MSEIHECPHCGDRWTGDQDHCCHGTRTEDSEFRLTPKGSLCAAASAEGLPFAVADRMWSALERFCVRQIDGDSEFAALIFDGEGGTVMGANKEQP